MAYLDDLAARLRSDFEGYVPWFYLDGPGNVTVGVGCLIPDVAAAIRLPMRKGARAAHADEIAGEYLRVKACKPNCGPRFYCRAEQVELPEAAAMGMVRERLAVVDARLRGHFPRFTASPDGAKLALLDMAYNLGFTGLTRGYPRLCAAVDRMDWRTAAAECYRHGPNRHRNDWTRETFLAAAV